MFYTGLTPYVKACINHQRVKAGIKFHARYWSKHIIARTVKALIIRLVSILKEEFTEPLIMDFEKRFQMLRANEP
ncbi:MAG: hypothetical protein QXP19_04770 [Thermoproteota archaeon]